MPQHSITKDRPRRDIRPPQKYVEADLVAYALNVAEGIYSSEDPSSYSEAVSCNDSGRWMIAMQEEMESLNKNDTWDLVRLPKYKKIVRCKWLFKRKEGTSGVEDAMYKARLVAKGYSQVPGIDFTDVFSPVVKHSSIRALLGIVAMHNIELEQVDVKTAFLLGELDEGIYMQQPKGFVVSGKEDYVSDDSFVYLLLYVDDMLIAANDMREIIKVKAQFSKEFEMKDLRAAKKILGMEILRDRKNSHFKLSATLSPKTDDERDYMSQVPYSSAVGSLIDRVIGYVDSDFARNHDKRRSLTGYVFIIDGCAICWKATLQTTVALSTTETEYVAITEAFQEAIWLKDLFGELRKDLQITTVFCDNQSVIFTRGQSTSMFGIILCVKLLLVVILCLNDQDSNAIILPDKKKKNKKKEKERQVSKKLKTKNNNSKLSQSQKKKLKKVEEDKEKAILLAESIKTLKKHRIQDDLYSLMWSSRNLGQGETSREKRSREMQFSRAGLDVPHTDRPVKKRTVDDLSSDFLHDSEEMQPSPIVNGNLLHSSIGEGGVPTDAPIIPGSPLELTCQSGLLVCSRGASVRIKQEEDGTAECLKLDYQLNRLPVSDCHNDERRKSMDDTKAVQNPSLSNSSNSANCLPQRALTTPVVVHVSRPKEVENNRSDLPIVMMEQEIMEAINDNTCVIVCGETGCGKTTQVPQFLYEAGYGSNHSNGRGGIIGVTQPRRVAVLATAKRVAFELGLRLGKEVGFQVRHDRRIGDNCSIKFMTDGILLRELQNDFLLRRYSVLILDEAHERSLNTDILIGMLSRIIRERQKEYEEQQKKLLSGQTISPEKRVYPLKLVLMSATLRVEDFMSGRKIFCHPPPVMEVPTRQYPVTIHFSKRTEMVDYVGQAYKKILSIHKRLPPGGILVFVTGQREVEYLCQKLRKASKEIVDRASKDDNKLSLVSEGNTTREKVDKEISEAFDVERSSVNEITERFNSYDEDHGESYEDDSEISYDSADDSDLDVYSDDDAGLLNQKSPRSDGKLDVLGKEGTLTSLKDAFEALTSKRTSEPDSCGKELVPITEEGTASNESELLFGKVRVGANGTCAGPMCVLPLYAMLPASSQLRVFEEVKEGERLVVVATNVAETSLTIPGIKYVVDTGREKVKKYNSSNGMEAYEIQFISKASAAQRAGRAGRTGPGHCYRLYSSAVFNDMFFDFSNAEILKVPVDGVVLLLKSMHIDKASILFEIGCSLLCSITGLKCYYF
ncbi:putative ATP-dependent RNA helicase DHX37 [Capsicum annuum]|uniref:RNA helicase n=1 Tax=Capsicum annuum TaxID=4072 RepID=A0A2G2YYL0_CAPAN|nr:putative ATP-dependent RNA helicase DHX37 [Capsicum annuum]